MPPPLLKDPNKKFSDKTRVLKGPERAAMLMLPFIFPGYLFGSVPFGLLLTRLAGRALATRLAGVVLVAAMAVLAIGHAGVAADYTSARAAACSTACLRARRAQTAGTAAASVARMRRSHSGGTPVRSRW